MVGFQRLRTSDDFSKPDPELKLWRAVLSLAADDAVKSKVKFCFSINEIDMARSWFTHPTKNFYIVCNYAGYEADYVHDKMKKVIKLIEEKEEYERQNHLS